jgi:hypothetical protein
MKAVDTKEKFAWTEKKCWLCKKIRAINSLSVYNPL